MPYKDLDKRQAHWDKPHQRAKAEERWTRLRERKKQQLGMDVGTATGRLKQMFILKLAQRCGMDTCLRCKKPITDWRDISLDHIKAWLNVSAELFWDVENLGLSHKVCNKPYIR